MFGLQLFQLVYLLFLVAITYMVATVVVLILRKQKSAIALLLTSTFLCTVLWLSLITAIRFFFDFGSEHIHLNLEWTGLLIPALFTIAYSSYFLFRNIKK